MEGLSLILVLGGIMALASFLAGLLPLTFSLSHRQTRLLSSIGTGLLIGTAFIVIIPEGVETMYTAASPRAEPPEPLTAAGAASAALHKVGHAVSEEMGRAAEIAGFGKRSEGQVHEIGGHVHGTGDSSHAWIGIALITGFILMHVIDTLQSPSHSHKGRQAIPLTDLDSPVSSPDTLSPPSRAKSSTTIGLLIHSLADGVALGASTGESTQTSLGLVVFAAILVHKAPAAFGLTSVLLKQGFGKRTVRAHLLAFSLAAPIGAIVTWILITLLGGGADVDSANQAWWTGLVLVFSGGTFLYVAMHAMQENSHSEFDSYGNSRSETLLTITGMLLPLLTQVGHAHGHTG